jgi:hypothetical protein
MEPQMGKQLTWSHLASILEPPGGEMPAWRSVVWGAAGETGDDPRLLGCGDRQGQLAF